MYCATKGEERVTGFSEANEISILEIKDFTLLLIVPYLSLT